jgi:transcriptional regulator with XRE-family HTH domain
MRRSTNPQPALGAAIRGRRAELGLLQEAVANEAGITVAHLSGIEGGHSNPTWGTVTAIACALDVTISDLARRSEEASKGR